MASCEAGRESREREVQHDPLMLSALRLPFVRPFWLMASSLRRCRHPAARGRRRTGATTATQAEQDGGGGHGVRKEHCGHLRRAVRVRGVRSGRDERSQGGFRTQKRDASDWPAGRGIK